MVCDFMDYSRVNIYFLDILSLFYICDRWVMGENNRLDILFMVNSNGFNKDYFKVIYPSCTISLAKL